MSYNIHREQENIYFYSSFWDINNISPEYRFNSFDVPIIQRYASFIPVHPDMFTDLKLDTSEIVDKMTVVPTSSFRTVYFAEEDVFYKLPVLRQITRGIRDLKDVQLVRSNTATNILNDLKFEGFYFLPERCYQFPNENFNYIRREFPRNLKTENLYPWFSILKTKNFSNALIHKIIINMLKVWMFYAGYDIYLELHTQNMLVDDEGNIYYRDLSDIKSYTIEELQPSYINKVTKPELISLMLDRAVCNQNLSIVGRYYSLDSYKIKELIKELIIYYNITLPNYSMGFPSNYPERRPERTMLNFWRT